MTPTYNKVHNKFKLNNITYSHKELKEVAYSFIKEGKQFEKSLGDFLIDWLDSKDYINTKTSGTTGKPKTIKIKKQAMVYSAIATGNYFGLKPGERALHCLPTQFIAGKMMLVRAIILGLQIDVIKPKSVLQFSAKKHYDFCAMIPMQLQNNIKKISNIKKLIVGGAPISSLLLEQIQPLETKIFATYGMTETITHIAVKKLNNFDKVNSSVVEKPYYETLPNIHISQDERSCLVIAAPNLSNEKIITNDVVKLQSETSFEWQGRIDHVINSGGIKLFPELIELKLQDLIESRFFIASEEDKDLGQKVILVIENESADFDKGVFSQLQKHEIPKVIYTIPKFLETETGKLQRKKILDSILS